MIVYPVIHYKDDETALKNAEIAYNVGCDGVFLISMNGYNDPLYPCLTKIKEKFKFKVGLNLLGIPSPIAFLTANANGSDMIWSDDRNIANNKIDYDVLWISDINKNINKEYFTSIAFKTHNEEDVTPWNSVYSAKFLKFIPTTSGDDTGIAPSITKIEKMISYHGGPLAVASGLTPDNIISFKPYITHALVATGISSDFYNFSEKLLNKFIENAKK